MYITSLKRHIKKTWSPLLRKKIFVISALFAFLLLLLAGLLMGKVGNYVQQIDAPGLEDEMHNILPLQNLNLIATIGHLLAIALIFLYFIYVNPAKIPYACVVFSLLVILRSLTIFVTHMGAPISRIDDAPLGEFFSGYYYTKDLFFSGHVATAFTGFLLISSPKWYKYVMLVFPFILGYAVLAMRTHYSIDVIGGFVFAYAVYMFSERYLKKKIERITGVKSK